MMSLNRSISQIERQRGSEGYAGLGEKPEKYFPAGHIVLPHGVASRVYSVTTSLYRMAGSTTECAATLEDLYCMSM